ncbi:hypothetical protein BDZ91DRAFT_712448 [Kalaharituber pfeilii]|nr:hypothetical protein BDZ91DRAFT_717461 [Kalaharituber pfeilii]KAF8475112.1 hypothetical protein BDZ91DRAFT_712448 [Kalaharituber pfeilii]
MTSKHTRGRSTPAAAPPPSHHHHTPAVPEDASPKVAPMQAGILTLPARALMHQQSPMKASAKQTKYKPQSMQKQLYPLIACTALPARRLNSVRIIHAHLSSTMEKMGQKRGK